MHAADWECGLSLALYAIPPYTTADINSISGLMLTPAKHARQAPGQQLQMHGCEGDRVRSRLLVMATHRTWWVA